MTPAADEPTPTGPAMGSDTPPETTFTPGEIAATPTIAGGVVKYAPPPIPFDLAAGAPEKFPIEVLPPLLRDLAKNLADLYQAPVSLSGLSALAMLSGAVGDSVVVRRAYKDKDTRLNLYVVLAADRGTGKGNIGAALAEPMTRRSKQLAKDMAQTNAESRGKLGALKKEIEALERKVAGATGDDRANLLDTLSNRHADLKDLEIDAAIQATLMEGNTTSEALERALADNYESIFSYSAEAGGIVQVALGKYTKSGDGDYDLLLAGYGGDWFKTNRITRKGSELEHPCIALLWLVQRCIVLKILGDKDAINRGLPARMLLADTGAQCEYDDERDLTFEHKARWNEFIEQILDARLKREQPRVIHCTPNARTIFSLFHNLSVNIGKQLDANLAGELSRWRENAIKVAGLFALAEGVNEISVDLAQRATKVVYWCGMNYLGILKLCRADRKRADFDRIAKLLDAAGGEIAVGLLQSANGYRRPALDALVAGHPDALEILTRPSGGPGKPAVVMRLKSKSSKSSKSPDEVV